MKSRVGNPYSPIEIDILREHYPSTPKRTLLKLLPRRSWRSIQRKAQELGIRRGSCASLLRKSRVLAIRKRHIVERHTLRSVLVSDTWDKDSAWLFGVLFRKSVIGQGPTQQLIFCSTRKSLAQQVASALGIPQAVRTRFTPTLPQYFVTTSNKELIRKLMQRGLVPLKRQRKFPNIPKDYIWHFLRGFFDSQSWILTKQRRWGIGFAQEDVVRKINDILYRLAGIKNLATGMPYKISYKKEHEWLFTIGGKNLVTLYQYLYNDTHNIMYDQEKKERLYNL